MSLPKVRLLIVDDHPIVQRGLAQLFSQEADFVICGQATNSAEGLSAARTLEPDLAIVDLSLRGSNGLDLIKDLRAFLPKLPVLVFSIHDEALYAERALRAGARGYMMKHEGSEDIITAVRRLLAGQFYVSEAINSRMIHRFVNGQASPPADAESSGLGLIETLSDRELGVFQLIGQGKGTRLIAGELHISIKTVETGSV